MSQRNSEYVRRDRDVYETPEWVTLSLLNHIRHIRHVWEPACGSGKMIHPLLSVADTVQKSDISEGIDFLKAEPLPNVDAIITNPPYSLADAFISRAIKLMQPRGLVAMLLRVDFDSAKTRKNIFGACHAFSKKIILTKRIRWIEGTTGSPSENHAWFVWDWQHRGAPTMAYAP